MKVSSILFFCELLRFNLVGVFYVYLTKNQKKVMSLIKKGYSIKKIAKVKNISTRAVYKTISQLKSKGQLNYNNIYDPKKVQKGGVTCEPSSISYGKNPIRLHNIQYHIMILERTQNYTKMIKKYNQVSIDNNTIMLSQDYIEIYSNNDFIGKTPSEALFKCIKYFDDIFIKLENQFKITIVKPRKHNIKLCRFHYSEVNSEIAKEYNNEDHKIRIFAQEDNKLAFLIDDSFNLNEVEAVHPQTAKPDIEQWKKHINDWRVNKPPTLSEIMILIDQLAEQNKETAKGLNAILKLIYKDQYSHNENKNLNSKPDYIY